MHCRRPAQRTGPGMLAEGTLLLLAQLLALPRLALCDVMCWGMWCMFATTSSEGHPPAQHILPCCRNPVNTEARYRSLLWPTPPTSPRKH